MNKKTGKKKNVTVNDIAQAVGMSASTVSRALANHPKISKKSKEIIWKTAKKLGYLSNIPAYLQNNQGKTIVILIDNTPLQSHQQIIASTQKYVEDNDFQILIKYITTGNSLEKVFKNLSKLEISGFISLIYQKNISQAFVRWATEYNIPVVALHQPDLKQVYANIIPDYFNGMSLLIEHLTKRKAKNIVLLNQHKLTYAGELEKAFANVIDKHPAIDKSQIIDTENDFKILKFKVEKHLQENPDTDGFITGDYPTALQLHYLLTAKKYNIPKDIMIGSFGNETGGEFLFPKITRVSCSLTEMGKTAGKKILETVKKDKNENQLIVKQVKLIIRNSTMRIS